MTQNKVVLIGLAGLASPALQAEKVETLEPLTVLARRIDSPQKEQSSSISVVTAEELERRQRIRLLDALELIPGTQALSTAGLTGNTGTLIIRGLPTGYQQLVVDGVRIADATNGTGNFLANAQLGSITSLEVLRGPQSVLYGTGAGGGVVGFETRTGDGEPKWRIFGEAGSFDTWQTSLSSEGQVGDLSYGIEFGHFETSNDTYANLPRQDYRQDFANLALSWQANEDLRLKFSYRGTSNHLKTTAVRTFGNQNASIGTDNSLAAFNLYHQVSTNWQQRLTLGFFTENYAGDFDGFGFGIDYDRTTLDWSHEIELNDSLTLLAGIESSFSDYQNTSGRDTSYGTVGIYAGAYFRPLENLLIEAGGRYHEHEKFGGDPAWNFGLVYEVGDNGPRLHARISEAFRHPTLLDSEFFPTAFSTQLANSGLESEKIKGYEFGITQDFHSHEIGLVWYQQDLTDPIFTDFVSDGETQRRNRSGKSTTSGLEFSAKGNLGNEKFRYQFSWTEQDRDQVIDLPDRLASFDLQYQEDCWMAGIGISHAGGASYLAQSDPKTDSRTTTRIYGQLNISENLKLHARVENLFDENYELFSDAFGPGTEVQAPGRAFYVGANYRW